MEDLARDRAGQRREQEDAGVGDRARVAHVPAEGRLALPGLGEDVEAVDVAGGDRRQRAGRDEVRADAAGPEVARQVPVDRLERRLRDPGPVVGGPGPGRVEVEADDRTARLLRLL